MRKMRKGAVLRMPAVLHGGVHVLSKVVSKPTATHRPGETPVIRWTRLEFVRDPRGVTQDGREPTTLPLAPSRRSRLQRQSDPPPASASPFVTVTSPGHASLNEQLNALRVNVAKLEAVEHERAS